VHDPRQPGQWALGRRPALDGLRGVAVLAVMLFHGPGEPLVGGFLGVDIFFVLSGFLITSLLVAEVAERGRVAIGRFWIRRLLRLVPALGLLCVVLVVVRIGTGEAQHTAGMPQVLLYVANWARTEGGLLAGPLTHTWSLAIEEQFYVVWPLVLGFLLRRRLPVALAVTVLGVAGSAILRSGLWDGAQSYLRVYNGSDTRADGLLLGCAVALAASMGLGRALSPKLVSVSARIGLALLGVLILFVNDHASFMYEWGLLLVNLSAAAVVVALAVVPDARLVRLFSLPPLVAAGRLSYGLYLWNLPVNYFFGNAFDLVPAVVAAPVALVLTWLLAAISRGMVEEPALRLRDRLERNRVAPVSSPPGARASGH
jgi:peptidoglycan/LPS O-acetylase OafA/YrhL